MSRSSPSYAYQYREIGNYTFSSSSFTPSTETTDGLTFIENIYATSTAELYWWNGRLGSQISMYCRADADHLPRVASFSSSNRVNVYDSGVPVRSHMAYWSQNTSDAMYSTGTTTKHNPSVVVIDDNDTYMIVEKKSHGRIEIGSDYVNRTIGLTITNLPPNTAYQINDNYGLAIYGSTNDNGIIFIPYEPRLFSVAGDLSLNILHDMDVFNEMSGMSVYDIRNRASLHVPNSKFDGVVYGTTQYMKLPIMIDTTIDSVTLAVDNCIDTTLSLPYLARNYTTIEDRHIWIPVVPGLGTICITVDGTALVLRLEDFQSGDSAVEAPGQAKSVTSSPGFVFRTQALTPLHDAPGNPLYASTSASAGSQFVVTTSGTMAVLVSGTVYGTVDTLMVREYADDTLSGTVSDIENSGIGVGINVYKNGERIKYVSLGTFDASGQSHNVDVVDLPQVVRWYVASNREQRPYDPLEIPWYRCDSRVTGGGPHGLVYTTHWKCPYSKYPLTSSACLLDASYQIRGSFDGSNISFDVEPGDIIEYRLSANLRADHSALNCGNSPTGAYGTTSITLDLKNVVFDHTDLQD